MNCMKRDILKEASVQCMEESTIISSTHTLKVYRLVTLSLYGLALYLAIRCLMFLE